MPALVYPLRHSWPETDVVFVEFVGAIDIETAAATNTEYTISRGAENVKSITRTAEGIFRITLKKSYSIYNGSTIEHDKKTQICAFSAQDLGASGGPQIDFVCAVSGSDTDPDSTTFRINLFLGRYSHS